MSELIQDEVKCDVHDRKSFYKDRVKEFVDFEKYDADDYADMAHLSHVHDKLVHQ